MPRSDEALIWPDHFPPKTRWKRFFIGVGGLGPDLSFFPDFQRRQAARDSSCMSSWRSEIERRLALLIGETFHHERIGWQSPFFLPVDCFGVIANGPRLLEVDDLASLSAIERIEKRVNRKFDDEFWQNAMELSLQEVVREMLERGAAA